MSLPDLSFLLHALGPAGDDAVERELGGLAALVGAVELLAIGEGATVMHFHGIGDGRGGAHAFLERQENQAAGAGDACELRHGGGGKGQ